MRILAKVLSIGLIFTMMISLLPMPVAYAVEEPKEYSIDMIGTDGTIQNVPAFLVNDQVMMPIETVAEITRCTWSKADDVYKLKHAGGLRTVELNVTKQTLTENGETYNTFMVEHDGTLLVPAYEVLSYLGAYCSVDETTSRVRVLMPLRTFWEAYMFTFEKKMNVTSYENKNFDIACDLIVDFFAPMNGQGIWSILSDGADETRAVYAALEVETLSYPSVGASTLERTQKLNALVENLISPIDKTLGKGFDLLFLSEEETRSQIIDVIFSIKNRKLQEQSYASYQKVLLERENFKKMYKSSADSFDYFLLMIDTMTTVYDRLQIDSSAKDALKNTFASSTLSLAKDPSLNGIYLDAARKTINTLDTVTNTFIDTTMVKTTDFILDKCLAVGVEETLTGMGSTLTLTYGLYGITMKALAEQPYAKYTPFGAVLESEADLMAILSSEYYHQVLLVMDGLANKATEQKFHDAETMKMLYDAYLMLLRFSLVHHESRIKYAQSQFFEPDGMAEQEQRADAIAKALDDLEHSQPTAIPIYSDLKDASLAFGITMKKALESKGEEDPALNLPSFPTIDTQKDGINIVAITPSSFSTYGQDVHFTVTIDYSLQSKERGIVYLGFNVAEVGKFRLVEDHLQVTKGSNRITLEATVQPAQWGSTNQGTQGALDALGSIFNNRSTAFRAYVNLSEDPHPQQWTPLAEDFKDILPTKSKP